MRSVYRFATTESKSIRIPPHVLEKNKGFQIFCDSLEESDLESHENVSQEAISSVENEEFH